ncbi:MAG TPA: phosphoribosyltransferase [Rickettsiales bacterium]|nr:phosphoribosyltransferase [Rickettsiales bacterium]
MTRYAPLSRKPSLREVFKEDIAAHTWSGEEGQPDPLSRSGEDAFTQSPLRKFAKNGDWLSAVRIVAGDEEFTHILKNVDNITWPAGIIITEESKQFHQKLLQGEEIGIEGISQVFPKRGAAAKVLDGKESIFCPYDESARPPLVNADICGSLQEKYGHLEPSPVIVPIRSTPRADGSMNYMAEAFAWAVSQKSGIRVAPRGIGVVAKSVSRTDCDDADRLRQEDARIDVPRGLKNVILLDDTVYTGRSMIRVAEEILAKGGSLLGAPQCLRGYYEDTTLFPSEKKLELLEQKIGAEYNNHNEFWNEFTQHTSLTQDRITDTEVDILLQQSSLKAFVGALEQSLSRAASTRYM